MSVAVSGSNPAYSLQSVLSAQLAVFTEAEQLSSAKGTNASADPAGAAATFNNLTSQSAGAAPATQNTGNPPQAAAATQSTAATTPDTAAAQPPAPAQPANAGQTVSIAALASANDEAGHLNGFLSVVV